MSRLVPTAASVAAAGALALAGNVFAAPDPSAGSGQHVATCAQDHLGKRSAAPGITCSHDGTEMTFPTFGAMVQHMQQHHG